MDEIRDDAIPPHRRPRAIRVAWVAALVAGGVLLCWATFLVEQRLSSPASPPTTREVTLDVVVSDADTGKPVVGAEVGIAEETGQFDPPGPKWMGRTDAGGRARLAHGFGANTAIGKDGKVRGKVVFIVGTAIPSFSYLLVVRASGYREEAIRLEDEFRLGIDYEDPSPRTIRVRLSPSHAR